VDHSPLDEFYDSSRKKIMALDDNILANPNWQRLLEGLCATDKPFTLKQGVDLRLINMDFIKLINQARYDGELLFAFDDIADSEIIERKLSMFRENSRKAVRVYILCGYDPSGRYDHDFWLADIENIFKRLAIIGKYQALPYIMRYEKYLGSPYAGLYKTIANYCNACGFFRVSSLKQFCENHLEKTKNKTKPCSRWRYYADFVQQYPHFETRFFSEKCWLSTT